VGKRESLPLYGQLKEHVSFSELKLFNDCNWKWLLLKVLNVQIPEDRSFQMDFGKAIHSGMEVLYGPDGGDYIKAAEHATKLYEAALSTIPAMHPTDNTEAQFLKEIITSIFQDSLSCPDLQGIKTLTSEMQLYQNIERTDGLNIKFKGFIDIVFVKKLKIKSVIYIADFKTCQWGWPVDKLRDIEIISQLLLYKHFFCKITGADPKNVTVAFILLKKKPKVISAKGVLPKVYDSRVEVVKIPSGPKVIESAINYLQKSLTAMHLYSYNKNFESCTRSWIDAETEEERIVNCPFLNTENCTRSEKL
jgi:hypothetical protein